MESRNRHQLGFLRLFALLCCFLVAQPAIASGETPAQDGPSDLDEIEAFMGEFWRQEMQPLHIPGAVFVLVKDGKILFEKGYGLANIEQKKPVEPGATLFAVGSVSKAVTAGAVLQMVERGKLKLDDPVNNYLHSFKIEKICGQPVTMAHLLTHSAGFDERAIGAFVLSPDRLVTLADYVARDLPPCIRPPGEEMSYCNHCYGLAGLVVQEITGIPFEQFVEENLFQPLEMMHSSFRQPLPAELDRLSAAGYIFGPGIQPAPRVYGNFFPSGGLWSTGEDMGRLIIAYLQGGLSGEEQVLQPETLKLLQQKQFSQDPRLEGWTYGFFEHVENGQRLIGKDGDYPGFSSALYLMPEKNLGFFLSYNATVPAQPEVVDPRMIFPSHFLDHYFPAGEDLLPAKPSGEAARLAGLYRWSRFSHTSIDKALSPMSILQWQVSANPDGSLTLAYPSLLGGLASLWVEVEPGYFQNQSSGSFLAFEPDSQGRVTHIYTKITEEGVLERVAWYETLAFQGILLIFMVMVFAAVLAAAVVRAVRRAAVRRQTERAVSGAGRRVLGGLPVYLAGLNLVFLIFLGLAVAQSLAVRAPQAPWYLVGLLVIPLVTAALEVILLAGTVIQWKSRVGSISERISNTVISLAGFAFTWFAWYWNLLGFQL